MNLKVSVWSNYFHDLAPEDRVKAFISKGFETMELSTEDGDILLARGNIKNTAKEFKKFLDGEGFTLSQGHLKLICDICMDNPMPLLEELKGWIELYGLLGIKNMVLHCGGENMSNPAEELMERRVFAIRELVKAIEGSDKYICLENLVVKAKTSGELKEIIRAVGSKNLAITLDTGHLNLQNKIESQYDFIKDAGSLLRAIHLADNEGERDQHLLPYACAKDDTADKHLHRVDFEDVVRGLKEVGYKVIFNYEIPGESYCPMPVRMAKLDYVKEISKYLLSL